MWWWNDKEGKNECSESGEIKCTEEEIQRAATSEE